MSCSAHRRLKRPGDSRGSPIVLRDCRSRHQRRRAGQRGRSRRRGRRVGCRRACCARRDQTHLAEAHSLRHRHGPRRGSRRRQRDAGERRRKIFAGAQKAAPECRGESGSDSRLRVLRHMAKSPPAVGPPRCFITRARTCAERRAIEVLHQPAAHTDNDVFAFFRRSDVLVAGDVLDAPVSRDRRRARRSIRARSRRSIGSPSLRWSRCRS